MEYVHKVIAKPLYMKNRTLFFVLLLFTMVAACSKGGGSPAPPPVNPPPAATPPTISTIAPDNGVFNTVVTITGTNFSTTLADNEVKFNNKAAKVTSATATQLIAEVPKGAGTGTVTVTVKSKTATGPVFNYTYTIMVSTVAGSTKGYQDGVGAAAQFDGPRGICIDPQGNLFVSDHYGQKIRKVTLAADGIGTVTTFAGSVRGLAEGAGAVALFWNPQGLCSDAQGNIYVADQGNDRIRKITPGGMVSTFAGSTIGYQDGAAGSAKFYAPEDITIDAQGNFYVADANNYKVRKITPSGQVSTLAGSNWGYLDGNGTAAQFYTPRSIYCDANSMIYVADYFNYKIRKITPTGTVTTIAGTTTGYLDGPIATAKLDGPRAMWVDAQENIYLVDDRSNTLRKITKAGMVITIAGKPDLSFAGFQDGDPSVAKFFTPSDMCADAQGNLYIADFNNQRIRKVSFE
jgi:sugar lactone lactonase YvrE